MIKKYKYDKLVENIRSLEKVLVAFSGGVDSTFLLKVCKDTLKDKVMAITIKSPYISKRELDEASQIVRDLGVRHLFLDIPIVNEIKNNPNNRCYICKKNIFTNMIKVARENNIKFVLDGTNADDIKEYRPGIDALKELNITSPLKEAGLTKKEIRQFSKKLNLSTWDKPAYACLLTRIPYFREIKINDLVRIEQCEKYLESIGFKGARVRDYKDMARIEIPKEKFKSVIDENIRNKIVNEFKILGYNFITIDLEGYRVGSMDQN
ncbi:ATP-dependent sacrificial sulfur transferase LarE [Clostridium rectalis]|uniref:ATP-dependent sacrificial sulfur transferase LarE n=1 Tax=Clostridium rectalis TaxID=2040295 RepID=UPI000F6302F9|nr:ATP-dependent sacrificial sulfur transferase LarE [Clostridium rectalis]